MRKLSVEWFRGLPEEKKEGFELALRNSSLALGRLYDLLDEWERDLDSAEAKLDDYDNPSWSHKQAHRNGDRSRIRKLRDLLGFLKGDLK